MADLDDGARSAADPGGAGATGPTTGSAEVSTGTVVLVGALVVIAAAAIAIWAASRADDGGPIDGDVVIVGDSVTEQSHDQIVAHVGRDGLEVIGRSGYRSDQLLPLLEEAMAARREEGTDLDKAAFLVGYNDVFQRRLDASAVAPMVELSSEFDCAVWLTLPSDVGEAWNRRLAAEAESFDDVHVDTRWSDEVLADPGRLLQADGIHPSAAGRRELATAYRDALAAHC